MGDFRIDRKTVGHGALLLAYLDSSGPEGFRSEIERLLGEDAGLQFLDRGQRLRLFTPWSRLGDLALLEAQVAAHPDWIETAWVGLAKAKAARREFAEACALAERHAPPATLPTLRKERERDLRALRQSFLRSRNDLYAAFALYMTLIEEADREGALLTVQKLTGRKEVPAYWHYLEARLQSERQAWGEAWRAWERYVAALERSP